MLLNYRPDGFRFDANGVTDLHTDLSLHGQWSVADTLRLNAPASTLDKQWLVTAVDGLFCHFSTLQCLQLPQHDWQHCEAWQQLINELGAESVSRQGFYHSALCGHHQQQQVLSAIRFNERACPPRPALPQGEVYRRFDPLQGCTISFKVTSPEADSELFHRWMHLPRVAEFWQQAWPEAELQHYLQQKLSTPFQLPLIGFIDDNPFGYIELYWAAEDRIAPYYGWQAWDRGMHLLVGEQQYRGPHFFKAWCRAISHFVYQDNLNTTRIVLEPRADNQRLLQRISASGYYKQYEFDFPHKRAALVTGHKDTFFRENFLC